MINPLELGYCMSQHRFESSKNLTSIISESVPVLFRSVPERSRFFGIHTQTLQYRPAIYAFVFSETLWVILLNATKQTKRGTLFRVWTIIMQLESQD